MKKLVVLSPSSIEYVSQVARQIAKRGFNFSRALNHIIQEHKNENTQE